MTDPEPRASSVRRTVVVALALVAGQLALCAVIGWLTFGNPFHRVSTTGTGIAAPPAGPVDPTHVDPRTRAPGSTRPVRARRSAGAGPSTVPTSAPTPAPNSPPASRQSDPATVRRTAPTSPAPAATPDTALRLPGPSSTIQEPVEPDMSCAPVNAEGRTSDGEPVRCLRTRRDGLRWRRTG